MKENLTCCGGSKKTGPPLDEIMRKSSEEDLKN